MHYFNGNPSAAFGTAGAGAVGTLAGPDSDNSFSALVHEAVLQARAGSDNSAQLSLLLAVLETERKRQEEVRKTRELELEIAKLSQPQPQPQPRVADFHEVHDFAPIAYDYLPTSAPTGPYDSLPSGNGSVRIADDSVDLKLGFDDSWLDDLFGGPSSSTSPPTSWSDIPRSSSSPDVREALPPPVPVAASVTTKRTSTDSRKRIEEVSVHCKTCNKLISTFILHYDKAHNMVDSAYTIELQCCSCAGRSPSALTSSSPKKRMHDELDVDCEICKRAIGSGGFKFERDDAVCRVGAGGRVCGNDDIVGAALVNFRAEILCASCKSKYRLCTECGGGGRFRTGKYRPVELFAQNRRTCSLSHVRIGGAPLFFEMYSAPSELTEKLIAESRDVHMDGFFGLYMCPEIIEVPGGNLDSAAKVQSWAIEGWQGAENVIRSEKKGMRKYLAAVYFDRKSAKLRGAGSKRIPATTTYGANPATPSSRFQVGYLAMEWDIANGTALLTNGYLRSMAPSTLPILRGLAERLLRKALEERVHMNDPSIPEIRHVWLFTRRQHARLQALCQRMGMMSLDQYLKLNPDVDRQIFMREVHVSRSLFVEIVSSVNEYLQSG
ncbi:hypothetical protein HDU86_007931 [Geranomyces michiganensis]|nr:hypothetical protein HDU86_007931 [Geranomyces michiganensis]